MAFAIISLKSANNNPYFRLDTSLLEQHRISNILKNLREHGLEITTLNELGFQVWNPPRMAMKRLRLSKTGLKTLFVGVGIAKKISINLSKIEIGYVPNENYLISEGYILAPETGEPACGYVFEGAIDALHSYYDDKPPLAATHNLFRVTCESCRKELKRYIALLLNTSIGLSIIGFAKYGALQPHYRADILAKTPIPLLERGKHSELLNKALDHEAKAWRAYFKAMKIVEEYLRVNVEQLSGTSSYKEMSVYGRLDSKFYVYLNALRRLPKAQILRANELFDIKLGTAPRSREYKSLERGEPYVSYDAIDDSGFIDEELFYRLPNPPRTTARARRLSIPITSVAHSIEGIGKVGILYPHDNMLCMTGLAILNPSTAKLRSAAQKIGCLKEKTAEELMLYTFAILKSRLMRRVMQSLTYGLTAQISKKDIESLPIPIIKDLLYSNVTSLVKEFIENMYKANALKRQSITELENYILRLLG